MRVRELGGDADLLEEAITEQRSEVGMEHLECDGPFVTEIVGSIDNGHSARAKFALQAVAVGQSGPERGDRISHID
jgi:hypothetical protein